MYQMSQKFNTLPMAGGLLDQDNKIITAFSTFEAAQSRVNREKNKGKK